MLCPAFGKNSLMLTYVVNEMFGVLLYEILRAVNNMDKKQVPHLRNNYIKVMLNKRCKSGKYFPKKRMSCKFHTISSGQIICVIYRISTFNIFY